MRRIARAMLSAALPALTLALTGCGPPQIGPDKDSFKAVDALYTAVSLRDATLVDRCARTLRGLRDEGKLPEAAAKSLDAIVARAKAGEWEAAQGRLGDFMRGQGR